MERDPGNARDEPVGDLRGETARPERVLPIVAPPADDVVPLLELVDQPRDVRRVVLSVPVHGGDEPPAGHVEAGGQSGRLAEVRPEPDHPERAESAGQLTQARPRPIPRAVVDDDHLVRTPEAFHDVPQARQQGPDVVLLVVDGDDDRQRHAGRRVPIGRLLADAARGAHGLFSLATRRSPRVRFSALR